MAANKRWRDKNRHWLKTGKARRKYGILNKRDNVQMVVYVIAAGPYTKVGIAEDLRTRLIVYKSHCPLPIEVVFCSNRMLRPDAREIEVTCHTKLIEHHVHGEWFKVSSEVAVSLIKTLTEQATVNAPAQLKLVI